MCAITALHVLTDTDIFGLSSIGVAVSDRESIVTEHRQGSLDL